MKKIFAFVLAAVTLALCLTGCVYEDLNVKLNKDGTGSTAATVGLKKDFIDQVLGDQNLFGGKETQEIEIDGDKYIAYTETKEYASFREIEKALSEMTYDIDEINDVTGAIEKRTINTVTDEMAEDNNATSDEIALTDDSVHTISEIADKHIFKSVQVTRDGSRYIFDAVLNPLTGELDGYDMSDIFKISVSVEMPAKVTAYKNGTVDGNKVNFDLSDMSTETELYAECKTASVVPVIICGVLVVASLAAFIVLRKRK